MPQRSGDARSAFIDALDMADKAGVLLWRAMLCLALGTIARGRFPEAEAALAEGEEFFRSRGAGTVVTGTLNRRPAQRWTGGRDPPVRTSRPHPRPAVSRACVARERF